MSSEKFEKWSPLPNWPKPKSIKVKNFSKYCEPVNQAIIDWLKRKKETKILNNFLKNRDKIDNEELKIIIEAYSLQTDYICMLAWH